MAFEQEQRAALRLLEGLEMGSMTASASSHLIEQADPALVYLVFAWLRARYGGDPQGEGVLGRLIAVCREHPGTTRILQRGERDPISKWFEESYQYRDLDRAQFIATVVEKLEG